MAAHLRSLTVWTLAISASGGPYDCALRGPDGAIHRDHAGREGLAVAVERSCTAHGVAPASITALLLDLGPGSYTGLRVAVAFARTLAAFGGATLAVATSLELLALDAWRRHGLPADCTVRPVLDARRGRLHHAAVRLGTPITCLHPPRAEPAQLVLDAIEPQEVVLVESALASSLAGPIEARGGLCRTLEPGRRAHLAGVLLDPALAPRPTAATELEPLYLMGSYAD